MFTVLHQISTVYFIEADAKMCYSVMQGYNKLTGQTTTESTVCPFLFLIHNLGLENSYSVNVSARFLFVFLTSAL